MLLLLMLFHLWMPFTWASIPERVEDVSSGYKRLSLLPAWQLYLSTLNGQSIDFFILERFLQQGIDADSALRTLLPSRDDNLEAVDLAISYGADIRNVFFESLPNIVSLDGLKKGLEDISLFLDTTTHKRTLYSCLYRVREQDLTAAVWVIARYEPVPPMDYELRGLFGRPYDDQTEPFTASHCSCLRAMLDCSLPVANMMIAFAMVHKCHHSRLSHATMQPSAKSDWFDIVQPLFEHSGQSACIAYIKASRALGAPLNTPVTGRRGRYKSVMPAVVKLLPRISHIAVMTALFQTGDGLKEEYGMKWTPNGLDEIAYKDSRITYRDLVDIAKSHLAHGTYVEDELID